MIVAIDGPAGSGKGTVAKIISNDCNLTYIDTGAMYRAIAYLVIKNNIDISDEEKIVELAKNSDMSFKNNELYLNGINVSKFIRTMEVNKIVSPISSIIELRKILVDLQRKMAKNQNVIMEGRDITTVVFPNADFKFYLDASVSERAKRRYKENMEKGISTTYDEVLDSIKKRDYNDCHKPVGALKRTSDAIYIDSSNMTIDEVVKKMKEVIKL